MQYLLFQNPTGKTWSLERRRKLAELSAKYGVAVIEDNPYGELRFEGESLPSIKSFDEAGNILCTGSFSKIFCPSFRIGWIAGDKEIIRKYVLVKQRYGFTMQHYCPNDHRRIPEAL